MALADHRRRLAPATGTCNRGKQSVALDLRTAGRRRDLSSISCATPTPSIEAMRPGALDATRASASRRCSEVNPRIVFCTISGYGMTGPYRDMPSHGIAYDTWAGVVAPAYDERGLSDIPDAHDDRHPRRPALRRARHLSRRSSTRARRARAASFEVAQSDAAAAFDWNASRATRRTSGPRTRSRATRPTTTSAAPPGTAGMKEGVRYQMLRSTRRHVLFMASEQEFWKNFCAGIDRPDLFEREPGSTYADHARGNDELQRELAEIFADAHDARSGSSSGNRSTRRSRPVNTPRTHRPTTRSSKTRLAVAARGARHRAVAVADQGRRRGAAPPRKAPRGRRAHRRRAAGDPRDRCRPPRGLRAAGVIGAKQGA